MRRSPFVLLALFMLTTTAWAQVHQVSMGPPAARVSTHEVVARMLSFDRNNDGRLEKSELAERMHGLITRGDVNGDGALDEIEIQTLSTAPPPLVSKASFGGGSYGFADEGSLSSRSHVDGALDDLRLPSPAREQAAAVVAAYVETLEATALADLVAEVQGVMSAAQLEDFKAAVSAQTRGQTVVTQIGARNTATPAGEPRLRVMLPSGLDAGRRIENYALPPSHTAQVSAAFARYKAHLRLGDTERSDLLALLKGILVGHERDDFRAALERRPVVARNAGVVGGVIGGLPEPPQRR